MSEVFLVYKTDAWHSYASRDIIGIGTTLRESFSIILKQVEKEGEDLSDDDKYNLSNIKQTQGYNGEGEFQIEPVNTNELL